MCSELFQPTREGEARLLLLISAFSNGQGYLEGRTKLAKLDFLLRYPGYLRRALAIRKSIGTPDRPKLLAELATVNDTVESRMVRYRYGPWDPSYFALLGCLIGKGLVEPIPTSRGIAYKATSKGTSLARKISSTEPWSDIADSCKLLKTNFNLSGNSLKEFIYRHFREVVEADWGQWL